MLSFQISNSADSITVYCDLKGLDEWINTLTTLRSSPDDGHVHMRAPSAGGDMLSEQNPWGEIAVQEVIVTII